MFLVEVIKVFDLGSWNFWYKVDRLNADSKILWVTNTRIQSIRRSGSANHSHSMFLGFLKSTLSQLLVYCRSDVKHMMSVLLDTLGFKAAFPLQVDM